MQTWYYQTVNLMEAINVYLAYSAQPVMHICFHQILLCIISSVFLLQIQQERF